ncbi:RNA 3'-terminal phosphate cyclase [soil metagenome]
MDGPLTSLGWGRGPSRRLRRWKSHAGHAVGGPHPVLSAPLEGESALSSSSSSSSSPKSHPEGSLSMVELDGSKGEGGGQILRTALSLSMLTGRPFRMVKIRANRDKPGLRPQHLTAVEAAAMLSGATVEGAAVGARALTFRPAPYEPRDLDLDIGTAGASALVLQTLHLPLALRADRPLRLSLTGGTFNEKAPSYPFLAETWRRHLAALGMPVAMAMPLAGFYPRGGGRLEAWIEPATPRGLTLLDRGPLVRISGMSGVSNLQGRGIADRMRARASDLLLERGLEAEIEPIDWPGPGQGAAIALTVEFEQVSATFVGLGARGKPAGSVAEQAVQELLDYLDAPGAGAVDPHSADQLLLPLALAEGRSVFTASEATEHLRTNAETLRSFLDRPSRIEEPNDAPVRIVVGE